RMSATTLRDATAAIMREVTALVARLRGEEPPAVPFEPNPASRTDGIASAAPSLPPGEVASAHGAPSPEPEPGNPEGERETSRGRRPVRPTRKGPKLDTR